MFVGVKDMPIDSRGTITLMVLLLLIVFVVIITASMQYIARQSAQTSDEEQAGQALGLADAGVQYISWALRPEGGGKTPDDLQAMSAGQPITQEVKDAEDQIIGAFAAEVLQASANALTVRVEGRDHVRPDICEAVEAEFQKDYTQSAFKLVRWEYLPGGNCD